MQPKQFNMLALAAVGSLIAAGVVHSSYNSFNEEIVSGQRLFASLETQADATSQIALQQGEAKLTFKKSADGKDWSLVERSGYPVDAKKLRELVIKLGETELIEKKTSNKDLYGQLDLGDPKAKGADAKLVRLSDAKNKTIAEVVIGKERREAFGSGKAGTYVRTPGAAQTWLAKVELNASMDVVDWVQPTFFRLDEQKIASISVKEGEAAIYRIERGEKKKDEKLAAFEFADVPEGKKTKQNVRIDDFLKGLRTLEMKDVRAAKDADKKPDMTAEVTLSDGAKYKVGMKREDKKRWMTVSVLANGKDEAAAKAVAEATKGWAFEIPEWRAAQAFKKADDIFETVKKTEAPKASTPNLSQPNAPLAPLGGPRMQLGPTAPRAQ